ncbi:hypothetical protein MUK42_33308 [Musa troglodytarum]|uniref:Uncharacterized protein n=1 Tax=Musa troglodytarum TaxID=320322 RepID=A0A9E7LB65_9LILI|nr:hypothetical protein MUK42_33308 [Musa troglodytarum]
MASSSQSERKGLKEDQETESSISKTIQRVGRGGDVDVELGLDGGARGEGLADERSFRRTSRDKVFSSSSLFLRLSQRPMRVLNPYSEFGSKRLRHVPDPITCVPVHRPASGFALFACPSLARSTLSVQLKDRHAGNHNAHWKMAQWVDHYANQERHYPIQWIEARCSLIFLLDKKNFSRGEYDQHKQYAIFHVLELPLLCCLSISSSYGQTLTTSTFVGETLFSLLIVLVGLVLFAHLIGNMPVLCGHLYLYCLRCVQVECLCGRCHRYLSLRRRVMGRRVLTSTAQDVDVSPAAIAFASVEMEI